MEVINPQNQSNPSQMPRAPRPKNHLVMAVLVTVFCCLPFGVVALIYSSKVDDLWYRGLYEEAWENSSKAERWITISFFTPIIATVLYILFFVVLGVGMSAL